MREREWRLATGGYLGHMFELYAFWTWVLGAPNEQWLMGARWAGYSPKSAREIKASPSKPFS